MKFVTCACALLALLHLPGLVAAESETFAVRNAEFSFENTVAVPPSEMEKMFLNMAILEAWNEVYADEDFLAEAVDTSDMENNGRRSLLRGALHPLFHRLLPGSSYGGATRIAGRCRLCPGRRLDGENEGRNHMLDAPELAHTICTILKAGPFEYFRNVSNCVASLEEV